MLFKKQNINTKNELITIQLNWLVVKYFHSNGQLFTFISFLGIPLFLKLF